MNESSKPQQCRGCGKTAKLIRAHIIPEAFCIQLTRDGKPAKAVGAGEYVRPSHTGIYDSTILCELCEQKLGAGDSYAARFFIAELDLFEDIKSGAEIIGRSRKAFDYALLQRFLVSVLWRASISTQNFFSDVFLDKHELLLGEIALGEKECPENYCSFVLGCLLHKKVGNSMLSPFRERIDSVNYWRIYFGDWHAWLKLDSGRGTPRVFLEAEAKSDTPLIAVCRNLSGSPEHKAMKQIVDLRRAGR